VILLDLCYVGHVSAATALLKETYQTNASTLMELIEELEKKHRGFRDIFVNGETGRMNLNAMIYYGGEGEVPLPITDLNHPIQDSAIITFW
jgi:hypothetical protein